MIALSLGTVLAAVIFSLAMAAYVNQAAKDTYAGIVGTVAQKYPLAEDPPEEDRCAFVERLRAQLGRIQWLAGALLKLARLDAGTAAFKSEPVDVRRLIERPLEPLQIPLEIKNQRLEVHGG